MSATWQRAIDLILSSSGERDEFQSGVDAASGERATWLKTRPSLPPLFFFALATWAGVALAIEALQGAQLRVAMSLGICSFGLAALSCILLWRGGAFGGCIALGLALGGALGAVHAYTVTSGQAQLLASEPPYVVQAVQDSQRGSYGSTFLAKTESGQLVRVVDKRGLDVLVGDAFAIRGTWKVPSGKSARDSWRKGIAANIAPAKLEPVSRFSWLGPIHDFRREAIRGVREQANLLNASTPIGCDDAAMMLSAIVLGHTAELYESELYQAVKADGLAHLVAVSGAHLAIVCGLMGAAFRRSSIPRMLAICMQMITIGGYLVLTGAPTSAVRAAVMATLGFASYFDARRPYALGGLSCCIVMMLALEPAAAFSTSLLLSAGATAGIIVFSGYCASLLQTALHAPSGFVVDALSVTLSASILTTVPTVALFAQVSCIAPLANLVVAPCFPIVCLGGLACVVLSAIAGVTGAAPLWLLLAGMQLLCELLKALASVPFASAPAFIDGTLAVPLAIAPAASLWLAWPRPTMQSISGGIGIVCGIALAVSATALMRPDAITVLDVGQGDAILCQSAGRSLLIDTGTEDTLLLQGLASCGVTRLDAVIISHPDDDHCGSLRALKGVVGVDAVLVAADLPENDDEHCRGLCEDARYLVGLDSLVGLEVGDVITCGRARFRVVGPDAYHDDGGNADSLVLVLEYDADGDEDADITGLFCGDAESEQIRAYIGKGRVGDVDLYKVAHHGSREAADPAMLDTLRPEVSLVSVGAYNRYGHPAPQTLERLEHSGSRVYRTDEQGAITCILQKDGVCVQTQR
ncbi:MAG: ComEC/Rec2 family competence protein [Coriobacteriia bacterium]|nr:ComEC/Rec2 family competence protein [Coriobacteriia bacterium]